MFKKTEQYTKKTTKHKEHATNIRKEGQHYKKHIKFKTKTKTKQ